MKNNPHDEFGVNGTELRVPGDFGNLNVLNALFLLDRLAENLNF
jgi:hypothetical protein